MRPVRVEELVRGRPTIDHPGHRREPHLRLILQHRDEHILVHATGQHRDRVLVRRRVIHREEELGGHLLDVVRLRLDRPGPLRLRRIEPAFLKNRRGHLLLRPPLTDRLDRHVIGAVVTAELAKVDHAGDLQPGRRSAPVDLGQPFRDHRVLRRRIASPFDVEVAGSDISALPPLGVLQRAEDLVRPPPFDRGFADQGAELTVLEVHRRPPVPGFDEVVHLVGVELGRVDCDGEFGRGGGSAGRGWCGGGGTGC